MKAYTAKAKKALDMAARLSKSMHHNYVGTEHILAGLLKEGQGAAAEVLFANHVRLDQLLNLIKDLISPGGGTVLLERDGYTPRTEQVLLRAADEAERFRSDEIGTEHILIAILKEGDCAASRLLNTLNVNPQKIFVELLGAMGEDPQKFRDELSKGRNAGRGTTTPTLDQYSRDLTAMARQNLLDPVIGRKAENDRVIQILSRRGKNNPCLIGEPGVGKTAVAEGIAQRIVNGTVPDTVADKRLVALDMSGLNLKSE